MGTNPTSRRSRTDATSRPLFTVLYGGRSGLPTALTSLVGREGELVLAKALLQRPDVRLLTLTGPGGIGKTRLAVQLASDLASAFPGGVYLVALAPVPDASFVASSIAHAVGILRTGGNSVQDELAAALGTMEALLVVDNFEHVLDAAPVLTDLLSSCPRLKILVTSRIFLRVEGEHVLPVPPLSVPDSDPARSVEDLLGAAAVLLFVERARAVDPAFTLTDSTASQVAEICRRLDGLPLAIELAAPRVRHLPLPELRARLDRRLSLLTGGSRNQPDRLRTMRDAIAWSFDLLSLAEQTLLCRLAAFSGGFSVEAAESVSRDVESSTSRTVEPALPGTATGRLPDSDILDAMATLIDASLVQLERRSDVPERYRMLETIREFAVERLAASDEAIAVQRAHAAYFLDLAERYEHADLLPDGDRVVAVLEAEYDNLRLALKWLEEAGDSSSFLRLAAALGRFWAVSARYDDGRTWLERALGQGNDTGTADRAAALVHLGIVEIYQRAYREAEAHLTAGLAGCQDAGDALHQAQALIGLGALASLQGNLDRGSAYIEEALAAAQSVADQRLAEIMAASVSINLAGVAWLQGESSLAVHRLNEGLRRVRAAGHTAGAIQALGDLGDLARDRGEYVAALEFYREVLDLGRKHPRTRQVADAIEGVAVVTVAVGRAERGARLLGAAEAFRDQIGLRLRVGGNQPALEQAVAAVRAVLGEAAFATAWAAGRKLSPAQAVDAALDLATATPPPRPSGSLTPRETEILRLLAVGQTDPAIAQSLSISVRTVESHVARIFAKLGVRTRTAAATAAIATGLVDPSDVSPS